MSIIGALPVTLANGTTADATQVMSNFNSIASQVNANGAALAGGNAFTGTQTVAGDAVVTATATQTLVGKTLTGPNGSVGNPTYSFSASSGSGMWSSTSNVLDFSTGGVDAVRIDSSQNLVILPTNGFIGHGSTTGNLSIGANATLIDGVARIEIYDTAHATLSKQLVYRGDAHTWTKSAASVSLMLLDSGGRLSGTALHNNASLPSGTTQQYIASGTYTPTFSSFTNLVSVSTSGKTWQWIRVGNVVTVSGFIAINATAAGGIVFQATLPISSATGNLAGTFQGIGLTGVAILSVSSNANFNGTASAAGSGSTSACTFTYEVV